MAFQSASCLWIRSTPVRTVEAFQLSPSSSSASTHGKDFPRSISLHRGPLRADRLSSDFCASSETLRFDSQFGRRRGMLVYERNAVKGVTAQALQGGRRAPRRLVDVFRLLPNFSRAYFKSPFRRALYAGIALLVGFYVAQTISLSFGALGINDVIAAAVCLLFVEYVTRYYHTRPEITFRVGLLNNFKMGFTYGLFIDAFKLAS